MDMKKDQSIAAEIEEILDRAHKARPRATHQVLEEILLRLAREIDALRPGSTGRELDD
ncbi:MAG: hypothetical protein WB801_04180 [Candidatus Dormiibacterota bacterium]